MWREILLIALDTLRVNKARSALTVLGVIIGITAIVGMTSLIRGFDESLRDTIRQLGPNTIFVAKFSGVSIAAGREAQGTHLLHDDGVRSELADRVAHRLVEAANQRGHPDDRRDADDDSEHGQRRAHLARAQRIERHREDFGEQARAHDRHVLFPPQRFDGIEACRPHRRIQPEEQADHRGDTDADHHRPDLHRGRQR